MDVFIYLLFVLVVVEVEPRALCIPDKHSTIWAMFCLYFVSELESC
jgi:hypothetical protein